MYLLLQLCFRTMTKLQPISEIISRDWPHAPKVPVMIDAYLQVHNDLDELRKKLEMVNGDIEKMQKIYAKAEKDKMDTGPAQEVEVRLTNIKNGTTAEIAMTEKILDDTHVQLQVAAAEADQAAASDALKEHYSDFKDILENLERYEASAAATSDGISPSSDKTSATIRTSNGRSVTVKAPAGVLYDGIPTPTHAPPNPNANTNAQTQAQGQGQAVGSPGIAASALRDLLISGVSSPGAPAPIDAPSPPFPGVEGAYEVSVNETLTMTQGAYGDAVVCIYFLSPFFHVRSMFVLPWMHYFNKLDSIYVPSSFVFHVPQDNPKAKAAKALAYVEVVLRDTDFTKMGLEAYKAFVEKHIPYLIHAQEEGFKDGEKEENAATVLKLFDKHADTRAGIQRSPGAKGVYFKVAPLIREMLVKTANEKRPFPILCGMSRSDHGTKSSETIKLDMHPQYRKYGPWTDGGRLPDPLAGPRIRLKAILGFYTPGFCKASILEEDERAVETIVEAELKRQCVGQKITVATLRKRMDDR